MDVFCIYCGLGTYGDTPICFQSAVDKVDAGVRRMTILDEINWCDAFSATCVDCAAVSSIA